MNYATGYALNINEIFKLFPNNKLKMTSKECLENFKTSHREIIVKKIFKYAIELVLNDCIENNVIFELPTTSKKSYITVKRFDGDKFVKARQNGKWSDVDFLNSNFSGYQMVFNYQYRGMQKEKLIYLDNKHKNRLTELTNQGKRYF